MNPNGLLIGGIVFLILLTAAVLITKLRKRIYIFLLDVWAVVRPLRMIILLLGLSYFAFTKPDQATDMFRAFGDEEGIGRYNCFAFYLAGLILWAATSWYGARVLLWLSDSSKGNGVEA
jgi:di/tricarboxylate transporter